MKYLTDRLKGIEPIARVIMLVTLVAGCVDSSRIQIFVPPRTDLLGFSRVLVAGFVTQGGDRIDLNDETARFIRNQLRSKMSLTVIDSEPVGLDNEVFTNVPFWKRMGEEYSEPLIVTGTVVFKPAAARLEQRNIGRRTIYLWHKGFTLNIRLVLINGRTGEIINSVALRELTAHATTDREGALSLYFRLMDQTTPSVLATLGQQTNQSRVLLK